ncbi:MULTISPECIES: hypothetical protein [Amycolatopsis]|uniref:DNA-binding transcriptional regulator, FadR family n=2 Tax=Amycolatopsis TaxID=1813 RepID=A0A1I3WKC9_9PSEU|nr:hypothetical protein [Amycolatopsis sacchari]SFK07988.1 DNA-binding transcriptional regulator, FadR family [Amycolatopsis sacchari]
MRGLSLMGLVEVRHGSGAYVKGSATGVVGSSLQMLLRFEPVGLVDVVRLAGVLHRQVALSGAERATDADLAALAAAIDAIDGEASAAVAGQVARFLDAFVATAHDPLLAALCHTLDRVVLNVTADVLSPGSTALATEIGHIRPIRLRLLRALTDHDSARAVAAADEYHAVSERIVLTHPELAGARLSDPRWAPLLAGLG